jgi:hypothetical protein
VLLLAVPLQQHCSLRRSAEAEEVIHRGTELFEIKRFAHLLEFLHERLQYFCSLRTQTIKRHSFSAQSAFIFRLQSIKNLAKPGNFEVLIEAFRGRLEVRRL